MVHVNSIYEAFPGMQNKSLRSTSCNDISLIMAFCNQVIHCVGVTKRGLLFLVKQRKFYL